MCSQNQLRLCARMIDDTCARLVWVCGDVCAPLCETDA